MCSRLAILIAAAASLAFAAGRPFIAIGKFAHESNSFNPTKTDYAAFGVRVDPTPAMIKEWQTYNDDISGFIDGAEKYGFDLYPTVFAGATPRGPVTDDALNRITAQMIQKLKAAPRKLDGMLLALHGAMVTESFGSGDAEVTRRIREAMGPDFPIVITHDCHANVSEDIVKYSTALITWKTVPHIDMRERSHRASYIMNGIVTGKFKPAQALAKPPMLLNIVYHNTSVPPMLPIVEESRRLEKDPAILAASVPVGYQYADTEADGPSAVVITNNDPARARREADRLSGMLWDMRSKLVLSLPTPEQAVKQAMGEPKRPIVLVETGDNIGGGSSGDATFLLAELLRQKATGWTVIIAEPAAVEAAFQAGVGGAFDREVGGKMDRLHGDPVKVKGRVKTLSDGQFMETEVRHGGGRYFDQGRTAIIEAEGSTRELQNILMLTTRRQVPFSLHQLEGFGVYPIRQKIIVVKAAVAFRAAYEPIAAKIIVVDTPGTTAVNPARFTYHHLRPNLFGTGK